MGRVMFPICLTMLLFLSGCASSSIPLEEKIRQEYAKNDRLEKFYTLQEKYDNIKVILWLNDESDAMWVTNFTLWCVFWVLPDLPEACATGSVVAVFYAIAWWIGVTLTGGGILAVLAWLGAMAGGIPGIPPTVLGIIFLCVMFTLFLKIFGLVF